MKRLDRYLVRQFLALFFYSLLAVLVVYLIVDLIENLDAFLDANTPTRVILLYYLYYIPMILVLILPVSTLLASVFSVGNMVRHNEILALKALGVSLYRVMGVLMVLGLGIGMVSFFLSEGVGIVAHRKKMEIEAQYLKKYQSRTGQILTDLKIHEPPDRVVFMARFDRIQKVASLVKIETIRDGRIVSRIDAPTMRWDGKAWVIESGYRRFFTEETETAMAIRSPEVFAFHFTPDELIKAQSKPESLDLFELSRFIRRVRASGQPVHAWKTDFHLRIAFPLSNLFIVLLSAPLSYNRRRQSLILGFGIALCVVFVYFGLVKLGQTLGHNGILPPFLAAWMGNGVAVLAGLLNLIWVRK